MRALLLASLFFVSSVSAAPIRDSSAGLSVRDGKLMLHGKPYRGIGVNYFSLASRLLANPNDTSSLSNLTLLAKARIPFVRFMCGGFWPAEQRLYLTNRELFFERLDRVVQSAEQNQVGLVPSLFWNLATVPDLVGEPIQELGNTNSRSLSLIRRFTADVVGRYSKSPAIWAWEFGNEGALSADLPNAAQQRPPVVPELGTPSRRTEKDELTSGELHLALVEFARTIRQFDAHRLIVSGNALPRASAWHNTHERSWKPDTLEQFREILRRDNPDPMDGISVHIYPASEFVAGATNISQAVRLVTNEARALGKPLFIGEFGVNRQAGPIETQKQVFAEMLAAIEESDVPLAAAWVFDFSGQDTDWNITFDNDRASLLQMLSAANQRLMPKTQ